MFGNFGVRGKILAVVAVPTAVLVLAAVLVTFNAGRDLDDANNTSELLQLARSGEVLVDDLQAERDFATNYVHNYASAIDLRDRAVRDIDSEISAIATLARTSGDPGLASVVDRLILATGLQVELSPDGDVEVVEAPAVVETGSLYELRQDLAFDTSEADWPEWPSSDSVDLLLNQYEEIVRQVSVLSEDPGIDAASRVSLARIAIRLGDEAENTGQIYTAAQALEPSLDGVYDAVDGDVADLRLALERIPTREDNLGVRTIVESVLTTLDRISDRRAQTRQLRAEVFALSDWYSQTIRQLNSVGENIAIIVEDPRLGALLRSAHSLDVLVETMLIEKLVNERIIRQGFFGVDDTVANRRQSVTTDLALAESQETVAELGAEYSVPNFGASFVSANDPTSFTQTRQRLAQGSPGAAISLREVDWPGQVETELAEFVPTRGTIWREAVDRADEVAGSALASLVLVALSAAGVVFASVFVALLIARRIVGPLRRLTTTATAVRQELPRLVERVALPGQSVDVSEVQIPVESVDEIGRLAEAFNSVNAATLSIAGEQAALRGSISEMFVNVARRDQVLLNRQLSAIDEMERTQDDADTLQRLFALDHLATRMRRNSESLLVLAGIDTGRRMRRAMPLSDVIRTASSEIELYERIQLELDVDPAMVGHSALTAAHLFAELLENATVFSDPGTPVTVRTIKRDGSYVVEVTDEGIGMAAEELQEANQRVLSTAASEILGAQRLGLFVVGRIARRIGARVEVESEEGVGTTARVVMPPSLFEAEPEADTPAEHVSDSAVDSDLQVPSALVGHNIDDQVLDTESASDVIPDEDEKLDADAFTATYGDVEDSGPEAGADTPDISVDETPAPASSVTPSALVGGSGVADADELVTPSTVPSTDAPESELPSRGVGAEALPVADEPISVPEVAQEAAITTQDINELIESDAASAPESTEVDLADLTSGVSPSGLPTRRKPAPAAEAPSDTKSVLGLPTRPSTTQMSALSGSQRSGFVPKVSASEVAPQTAEQRASMFRGFQTTRDESGVDVPASQTMEDESLGYVIRRESVAPDTIPPLEEDREEDN